MADENKLATFKWFTDNYTRGSWEYGVSDNMFDTSRDNVSATSNKAINYNDLLNPSFYSYNGYNIGATTDQCVCEKDIINVMRDISFVIDITFDYHSATGKNIFYFTNTYFDIGPAAISRGGSPIKLDVTIGNTTYNNVNIDYENWFSIQQNFESDIKINKVSVYRPNDTEKYILKPQITFNYATGLSVSIGEQAQAKKFATVGSEIENYTPDGNSGGGTTGGGTTGGGTKEERTLTIDSSWKSIDDVVGYGDGGFSFITCWGFINSNNLGDNIYVISDPETGASIDVKDEGRDFGTYDTNDYIAFSCEYSYDYPHYISLRVIEWGTTYSLS
jgi:hypothetical protein